ncbi:hypothetical protein GGH94_000371 [Coemansia aciculifera]|uniref:Ubiquitin-like protease family profile domain-containing protein n=1 Tax=Coemansia aciculifera TaxID=417176 RepID=A0A9W8IMS6_9FUNG|nr:hypothetical protein GGH94_000371 [Coemansia aciculifera]
MDSGDSNAKTQPQSAFAATAAAAGLRASQMLQDNSKAADADDDDDDQVLELVSGNTSDNDMADGVRRVISPEFVQACDRRDEELKDSNRGDEPKSASLQGLSSMRDRQALALGDTEQVMSSGRVQRSLAGFSSKPDVIPSPKPKDFFSFPSFAGNSNQRTAQPAEKLVNQLRPKTHRAADDDDKEGQSNSVESISTSDLGSSRKPPTANAGWISVGRSRDPLTSIYQDSGLESPMAHRRRSIACGPIDLRSPSPPSRPVISPPLKPQNRRPSKSSPQKQQPQQRLANVPTKSFPLRGIRIGNHVQIADVHAANHIKDPASHLKLTIRYVQRTMEISGLRESNELMKISVADISALEYNEQRNLAVMCMIPNDTMESLFEEDVFDPSCGDKSRCLIYLCWDIQAKGDKTAFSRLQESFGKDIAFATMDVSIFQKYASELTKPTSIDLISSDDDGGGVAKPANGTANADGSAIPLQSSGRNISASIGTSRESSAIKSQYWSSVYSLSNNSYASSIGERTRGKSKIADDDALWDEPSLLNKRTLSSKAARRTSSPSFFATACSGYDLRKPSLGSMAEPPSSVEEENHSASDDDDFVVQHQKVGVDISSLKFEYPPEGGKPIHVGGSDIYRLRSGEFLNDTIIEFYMRYIGENLRTTDAKLYERCFFFNTFFFKKLSQRSRAIACDGDEDPMGVVYSQLKKWTASVDLFGKDYIFVPINENIHWYLAIIANPRAMLSAKPEAPHSYPSRSDSGAASLGGLVSQPAASLTVDLPPPSSPLTSLLSSGPTPANLEDAFPSVLEDGNGDNDIEMGDSPDNENMVNVSAVLSQAKSALTPSTSELEADIKSDLNLGNGDSTSLSGDKLPPQHVIDLSNEAMPLAGAAATDVLKAKPKFVDPETTPSIIILDSLGNRHQPTFGLLRGYMQAEANYRHHHTDVAEVMIGKYAKVPLQTNLCDCGVFLLQYIENFLKDPTMFMSHVLNSADMRAWFDTGLMREKRGSMMRLAIRLANEHEQLQKSKADAKDSTKSEFQQAANETNAGSDQPSDPSPTPSVAMDSESGGKELRSADDTE